MKNLERFLGVIVIGAVITVGLASCGGDVNKVKNGVFSSYDDTITIGEALRNNSTMKGANGQP
jgi:hypothetical protein